MLPGGFRTKVETAIHQNQFVGGQSQRSLLKNSDRLWNQSDSQNCTSFWASAI